MKSTNLDGRSETLSAPDTLDLNLIICVFITDFGQAPYSPLGTSVSSSLKGS